MPNERNETEKERLDRNLNELLGGLRVVMPGVQVLFAFLLVVPFNERFEEITDFERGVYWVTLLSTAVAMALLIAPGAIHRVEFRADDKEWIVFTGNRMAVAGFGVLAVAIAAAVLFVTHFVYSEALSIASTALVAGLMFGLWYLVPFRRRRGLARTHPRANPE